MKPTMVFNSTGQAFGGPNGLEAQSNPRTIRAIRLSPTAKAVSARAEPDGMDLFSTIDGAEGRRSEVGKNREGA
jgi:hypothetical protein